MIDQVEFNSATFYRYAVVDFNKLISNLHGDRDLALLGIEAFATAMARALPTGKQNTFAAHNAPAFIGVVLRNSSQFNLANAFEKPIWPKKDTALSTLSITALANYDTQVSSVYGDARDVWAYIDLSGAWPAGKGTVQPNLEALVSWVRDQVSVRSAA